MKFKVTMALVILGAVTSCEKSSKRDALEEVENAVEEFHVDARKQLEEGGAGIEEPVDLSQLHSALDKAEDSASGEEKIVMKLAKYILEGMESLMAPLTEASPGLTAAMDYTKVETKDDIGALSAKARNYQKVNLEFKVKIGDEFVDKVNAEADKLGLKGKTRDAFFKGFERNRSEQLPLLMEIRDQDNEVCEILLKQHAVLKEYFGEWEWNGEEEMLEFHNDEALEKFIKLSERNDELAEEQQATQYKMLNMR
ncbi:MAG: hypothetical protein ACSHX9_08915 [Luteolibacter sp.]